MTATTWPHNAITSADLLPLSVSFFSQHNTRSCTVSLLSYIRKSKVISIVELPVKYNHYFVEYVRVIAAVNPVHGIVINVVLISYSRQLACDLVDECVHSYATRPPSECPLFSIHSSRRLSATECAAPRKRLTRCRRCTLTSVRPPKRCHGACVVCAVACSPELV